MSAQIVWWLGVIGGVTGPLGLIISYLSYQRDAARVHVCLRRGVRVTQGPADDAEVRRRLDSHRQRNEDPPMSLYVRDPDKNWSILEVTNVGRRKVTVQQIGWTSKTGQIYIPAGFLSEVGWLPAALDEGDSKNYPIEESKFDDGVRCVWARDSTGRVRYGSFDRSFAAQLLRLRQSIRPLRS
jgi:hypothetical protein